MGTDPKEAYEQVVRLLADRKIGPPNFSELIQAPSRSNAHS